VVKFEKWHALGNAYLVVERSGSGVLDDERVRRLCDVATGIGSDGVIEVVSESSSAATIVIWNPDGTLAEMSGNGVRIAARWLAGRSGRSEVMIETVGRAVHARMIGSTDAEIDVGEVGVEAAEALLTEIGVLEVNVVSVGNPHAVIRMDGATRSDLLRIGPLVETHDRFPARTNVQLIEPVGPNELRVLVWERGAGETPASGSSATAAAAVAVARGWCGSPVTAHMTGGDLFVTLAGSYASLLGPVEQTCVGETPL
jgi:diaminopimelate epimerase